MLIRPQFAWPTFFKDILEYFANNKKQRRQRRIVLSRILAQNTDEFCQHTTLHGIKYVGSRELYATERCFFGISIVVVLLLACIFILKAYAKWATTPVIVGINPVPTFINNEPFPAVTICNLNQARKTKVYNFSNKSAGYAMLQLLCKQEVYKPFVDNMPNWNNMEKFIVDVSQPCERMLVGCQFGGQELNCSEIFYTIVTDEGLCCVFNMLHPSLMFTSHTPLALQNIPDSKFKPINWYAEGGYPENLPAHFIPRATPSIGESMGLTVTLDVEYQDYFCSSSSSVGFKIALHSPNESPFVRETGVLIQSGRETKVRITPIKTETELHLRTVHQKYRNCLFHNEGHLHYFAHYTQRNCEAECIAEIMQKYCGCIAHFMPRLYPNSTVCSINSTRCVERVRLRGDPSITSCLDNCLPSCFDLTFVSDVFTARLSHGTFSVANEKLRAYSPEYANQNIAIVKMYFQEYSFRSNVKTEFIGMVDFLSTVGGLMGLFIGFSFISIAELLYFGILRPCRAFFQHKRALPKLPQSAALKLGRHTFPAKRKHKKSRFTKPRTWSATQKRYNEMFPTAELSNEMWQNERNYEKNILQNFNSTNMENNPSGTIDKWIIMKPIIEAWKEN